MKRKLVIPEVMDIRLEWWKTEIRGENSIYETARRKAESGKISIEDTTAQEFAVMVKYKFLTPKRWKEIKKGCSLIGTSFFMFKYIFYNRYPGILNPCIQCLLSMVCQFDLYQSYLLER